jgi:hypothetical protein
VLVLQELGGVYFGEVVEQFVDGGLSSWGFGCGWGFGRGECEEVFEGGVDWEVVLI